MSLEKLSEQQLTRQPEEVFDILCKLGSFCFLLCERIFLNISI